MGTVGRPEMTGWSVYQHGARVGRRIRQARRELGLTQAELANRVGVSLAALDLFETGKRDPSGELEQIAEITDKPVSWYTSEDDDEAGDATYETGLPAELRRRLTESTGRSTAGMELVDEEAAAPLVEPRSLRPSDVPSARGEDQQGLAVVSEDLLEERDALARLRELEAALAAEQQDHARRVAQMAEELERANTHHQELAGMLEESRAALAAAPARDEELAARSAELATREATLGEAQKDIALQSTQLETREAELRLRSAQLDTRQAELRFRSAQLDTRESELGWRSTQLETREAELGFRSAQLDTREAELGVRSAQLKTQRPAVGAIEAPVEAVEGSEVAPPLREDDQERADDMLDELPSDRPS